MPRVKIYFYTECESVIILYTKEDKEHEIMLNYRYFLTLDLISYVKELYEKDCDEFNCIYEIEFTLFRILRLNKQYMEKYKTLMENAKLF